MTLASLPTTDLLLSMAEAARGALGGGAEPALVGCDCVEIRPGAGGATVDIEARPVRSGGGTVTVVVFAGMRDGRGERMAAQGRFTFSFKPETERSK